MKRSFKKVICLVLGLVLVLGVLAGCGKQENTDGTDADAPDKAAVVINGEPVGNDLVSYMTFMYCLQGLATDEKYFDKQENVDYLTDLVLEEVKQYMLPDYIAKAHDITLNDEDLAEIDKVYQDMTAEYGGEEEMKKVLEENHLSVDFQKDLLRSQFLQKKLLTEYYGKDFTPENVYRAKHVLIKYDTIPTGEDGEPTMTEEEWRADRLALAQEISERAKNGENFDDLIKEYNEDPGMEQNPEGYFFIEGQMMPAFYEGTKALEAGGVSDPVEVSDYYKGFHIIQRLEVNEENLKDAVLQLAASSPATQADVQKILSEMNASTTENFEDILKKEQKNAAEYLQKTKEAAQQETSSAASESTAE